MRYIKMYEEYEGIESEYPGMFAPKDPKDEPQSVPGFENGTIDPDDDEVYGEPFGDISDAESYKTFLKIIKERNFEETDNEIKINLHKLGQDYCMSIYDPTKHLKKFLNNELKDKYISEGFYDIMEDIPDTNYTHIKGIIERVIVSYYNNQCDAFFRLKLKGKPLSEDTLCKNIITIDKLKSEANKFNI